MFRVALLAAGGSIYIPRYTVLKRPLVITIDLRINDIVWTTTRLFALAPALENLNSGICIQVSILRSHHSWQEWLLILELEAT